MYQRMRNAWVHSRIYNWPRDLFQVALFFAIWTNVALLARLGLGIWLMIMFGRFGNNYLECWDESEMSNVTVLMPIIVKDLVGEAYAFSIYGQPGKMLDLLPSYVFLSLHLYLGENNFRITTNERNS